MEIVLDTMETVCDTILMADLFSNVKLTPEEARDLSVRAAKVFQPRTPITTRELFAGRWQQITTLADSVGQVGLHVVIYGERGVGKSSLANIVRPLIQVFDEQQGKQRAVRLVVKTNANSGDDFSKIWQRIFGEILWMNNRPAFGLAKKGDPEHQTVIEAFGLVPPLSVDDVRRAISLIPESVYIVDEFDRAASKCAKEFTDLIKALSDFSVDCTVILVGVSDTIGELIADHASINRALVQILLPRMQPRELREILANAEKQLAVNFSDNAANLIVHLSQGLPHYTHMIGLQSVRQAANATSRVIEKSHIFPALKQCVKDAQQSVTEKHSKAVHSAHQDALFRHVLVACALTATQSDDPLGYFNPAAVSEPLSMILGRDTKIATFNNHLSEFCQEKRGRVLERIGQSRAHRYRFSDPLLVPFVLMDAINTMLIDEDDLTAYLA